MAKFSSLAKGQALSEQQYYKVVAVNKDSVDVVSEVSDEVITLSKEYVEALILSAHDFDSEVVLNATQMSEKFQASSGIAISVNFNTKVDEKIVRDNLFLLYPNKGGKILSEAEFQKKVKESLKGITVGEERTLVGRHYGDLNNFGRINFIDVEKDKDNTKTYENRIKQVDPRTLNWFVVKGVKYIKSK